MSVGIKKLALELLPNSPTAGLFVVPDIPEGKLANAIRDFAKSVNVPEVLALYDATLSGNAKDGAVFTADRVVFQNSDLSPVQEVRYDDIVGVKVKRKFLGGKKIDIDVNRGRATVKFVMDFSGKPDAADYVGRFLYESMMYSIEAEGGISDHSSDGDTDKPAVTRALQKLVDEGLLSADRRDAMLRTLDE